LDYNAMANYLSALVGGVGVKLLVAMLCGGAIGMERELRRKPAGLRTNVLICMGAALLMYTSRHIGDGAPYTDPARLVAQAVTGIGFIGAGVIMQARGSITGLTTAATIFLVMAVGITVGDGHYGPAVLTTVLILFVLVLLRRVEAAVNAYRSRFHYTLKVQEPAVAHARLLGLLAREGLRLEDFSVEHAEDSSHLIKFSVVTSLKGNSRLVEALPAVGTDLHASTSDESD
jgi:putative Mg2+ transporter-C (MgtC) family protein